jgi:uncharacterized membrane protein YfcA
MSLNYWYLVPVGFSIAVLAMSSGVSAGNFWVPVYLLWARFDPPLAFWMTLATMLCGYGSGVVRNLHQGTLNRRVIVRYLPFTVPAALAGGYLSPAVDVSWLILLFGVFVFGCGVRLLRQVMWRPPSLSPLPFPPPNPLPAGEGGPAWPPCFPSPLSRPKGEAGGDSYVAKADSPSFPSPLTGKGQGGGADDATGPPSRSSPPQGEGSRDPILFSVGKSEAAQAARQPFPGERGVAMVGGALLGLIAVGLGELMLPRLLATRGRLSTAEAVGSTVLVIFVTSLAAALVRLNGPFLAALGEQRTTLLGAMLFAGPAVIVGGQLGPMVARRLDARMLRLYVAIILVLVGSLLLVRFVVTTDLIR